MISEEQVLATTNLNGNALRIRRWISGTNWEVIGPKLLGMVCILILSGMLVAGLWPFHSPRNQVTWFSGSDGVHFGRRGTVLSFGSFKLSNALDGASCSMEIWLQPDSTVATTTVFAFYAPGRPWQFSLQQFQAGLALRSDGEDLSDRTRAPWFYVENILHRGKPLFVTVTSGRGQTSFYVDGVLAQTSPNFPLSGEDFHGDLILANSPVVDNSWSGVFRGLAFYHQELTPAQVSRHFSTWTVKGRPDLSEDERALALYLFDEHAGRVIHNQLSSGTDLYIPERYVVEDQAFLRPFWKEFTPTWDYCRDVLVNIGGFVPFGFLFYAYLSLTGRFKRSALVTILGGFMISLTIEVLQGFLPTRGSGTTDLITNTFGTCCGVWLYRLKLWRALAAKIWTNFKGVDVRPPG